MPAPKSPSTPAPAASPSRRGAPVYVPTDKDRLMVKVMVAGGIDQLAISAVLDIAPKTLRKHFRREIAIGAAEIAAQVTSSLITMAVGQRSAPGRQAIAPNFHAAKWFSQARMGWTETIKVDDGKPADTPMRVIVELVGEAAAPRTEPTGPRTGSRLSDDIRKNVHLVG